MTPPPSRAASGGAAAPRTRPALVAAKGAWNAAIRPSPIPARRRIEKVFGTVKRRCGLARARCMGRPRASLQVRVTFLACNLRRAADLMRQAAA